jgi:polar amino acid transport system substrate-binding protein
MKNLLGGLLLFLLPLGLAWAGPVVLKIYAMEGRPVSFLEGGKATGLVVELAREVQRRIRSTDPIEIVPWARANLLAEKEANVLLLSTISTPARDRYLRYVGPLFQLHLGGYALRSRAAELRARDPGLRSLRAGARRGSVFIGVAREAGYNLTEEVNGSETAARMLFAQRFDLLFDGDEILSGAVRRVGRDPDELELMVKLGTQNVNFAFSNGTHDSVLQAWEAALRDMKRDGSYQAIHRRWLPGYALPPENGAGAARGQR